MSVPMPSPKGTNIARLYIADDFTGMALDAMPKAAIPGAAGSGRGPRALDQDPDDNVRIFSSPGQAAYAKLLKLIGAKLDPDELSTATELLGELLAATDPANAANNNPALAGDSAPSDAYTKRFPNANRLLRSRLFG